MVEDFTLMRDVVPVAFLVQADAQVHVFAAVDVAFVKAADGEEDVLLDQDAGCGDCGPAAIGAVQRGTLFQMLSIMDRSQPRREDHAKVIVALGGVNLLNVADESCVGVSLQSGQHRLQPSVG